MQRQRHLTSHSRHCPGPAGGLLTSSLTSQQLSSDMKSKVGHDIALTPLLSAPTNNKIEECVPSIQSPDEMAISSSSH
jgi:hypothetical protein